MLRDRMSEAGFIDAGRLDIVLLTDEPDAAVAWISSHKADTTTPGTAGVRVPSRQP
jgi:hypothetical protein